MEDKQIINTIKQWAAPSLVGIIGMLVWRDVTEMRSDVKQLLSQQSANQAKIEILEKELDRLQDKEYAFNTKNPLQEDTTTVHHPLFAIKDDESIKIVKHDKKL